MNWHDEPITKPWLCNLCGCGAEMKDQIGPFLVTDWLYEEVAGAEYVDKLYGGNYRFTICFQCTMAIVSMVKHEPILTKRVLQALDIESYEDQELPLVLELVEETDVKTLDEGARGMLIAEMLRALDERDAEKAAAKADKARATRARNKAVKE